jgi:hypothetical protein
VTSEDVDTLSKLATEAIKEAPAIIAEMAEIWVGTGRGWEFMSVDGIDNDSVMCSGSETWRYGGYQAYSGEFPLRYLCAPDWREMERARRTAYDQIEETRRRAEAAIIEQRERAELVRLGRKYGDEDGDAAKENEANT